MLQLTSHMLADNKWLDEFFGFLISELLAVVVCPIVTFLIVLAFGLTAFHLSTSLYALLFRSLFSPFYWGAAVLIGFRLSRAQQFEHRRRSSIGPASLEH